jgi:hypothetical protein
MPDQRPLPHPVPWGLLGASQSSLGAAPRNGYDGVTWRSRAPPQETIMAKGQQRSNKEARKPKKAKVKTIAANPSQKGGARGLENLKNS